jgi:hypothetical protein
MTTSSLALTPQSEVSAIDRWEALASDIVIATQEDALTEFDYRNSEDNKRARSWVASLRKLKGKIERARKDAKAVHLERGRQVDSVAKALEADVLALIERHDQSLKALEAEERKRIERHRATLDRISRLAEGVTSAQEARDRLAELEAIPRTDLEEFEDAAAGRYLQARAVLLDLESTLTQQEADRVELETLRAELVKAQMAATAARTEPSSAEVASLNWATGEYFIPAGAPAALAELEDLASGQPPRTVPEDQPVPDVRQQLEATLVAAMEGLSHVAIARALVAGRLHPALSINWGRV